jgi:L-threonylcarbamoyladenylate synthase
MAPETWRIARLVIAGGGLVAFPTDTVYGVACDPYDPQAIDRLYEAKGRVRDKAIPLLLSGAKDVSKVARALPPVAARLGEQLWPGALTLVVPRAAALPEALGGGDTIAVRVPDHAELRGFLAACGGALATSSANLSGQPDALDATQAAAYLGEHVQLVVDGGLAAGGVPSTVVDCTVDPPRVLRAGAIDPERVQSILESRE